MHVIFVTSQHLSIKPICPKKGQDHYPFSLRPMNIFTSHIHCWDIFTSLVGVGRLEYSVGITVTE